MKYVCIFLLLIFCLNLHVKRFLTAIWKESLKFLIQSFKTLEDTCKETECLTMGSTPPPCPPSSHPTIPSFLYGFHLCLLLPSSPQEAPEALYIPDKTFSEGEKRRWWRGGRMGGDGGEGEGLQGHHNGTLLIALSAYANHQLSVSEREGAAGRYPKTCASYLTCAISWWAPAHSNSRLSLFNQWRQWQGTERERNGPNWLIVSQIDVKRCRRYGPSLFFFDQLGFLRVLFCQ